MTCYSCQPKTKETIWTLVLPCLFICSASSIGCLAPKQKAEIIDLVEGPEGIIGTVLVNGRVRNARGGRSVADLVTTLKEFSELGVGFVSLTEALDLTTPTGRAMAGLLAVFAEFEREILRERVRAGIAQARMQGKRHGRPRSAAYKAEQVQELFSEGVSKAEIARRLAIGRTSVRRILIQGEQ